MGFSVAVGHHCILVVWRGRWRDCRVNKLPTTAAVGGNPNPEVDGCCLCGAVDDHDFDFGDDNGDLKYDSG
ncbi:MAG: hypothetical protein MUF23_14930 [Pirellula sp.]|nr:hypothetical protein [Pirellula sp.]